MCWGMRVGNDRDVVKTTLSVLLLPLSPGRNEENGTSEMLQGAVSD